MKIPEVTVSISTAFHLFSMLTCPECLAGQRRVPDPIQFIREDTGAGRGHR